ARRVALNANEHHITGRRQGARSRQMLQRDPVPTRRAAAIISVAPSNAEPPRDRKAPDFFPIMFACDRISHRLPQHLSTAAALMTFRRIAAQAKTRARDACKRAGNGLSGGRPWYGVQGYSSVGRAAVSKTAGHRFEPCCPCHHVA